jgi:Flp pilus assembly protein TadG
MLRADEFKQPRNICQIGKAQDPLLLHRQNRKQKGQSMVEFAMVVPFLLLVVVGTIELGRAYYSYNTLSKAVREGARYVAGHPYDSTLELPNAKKMTVFGNTGGTGNPVLPNLTTAMVTITPRSGTGGVAGPYDMGTPPDYVKVSVSYPYTSVIAGLMTLNLNFTPAVEMRYVDLNARQGNP